MVFYGGHIMFFAKTAVKCLMRIEPGLLVKHFHGIFILDHLGVIFFQHSIIDNDYKNP